MRTEKGRVKERKRKSEIRSKAKEWDIGSWIHSFISLCAISSFFSFFSHFFDISLIYHFSALFMKDTHTAWLRSICVGVCLFYLQLEFYYDPYLKEPVCAFASKFNWVEIYWELYLDALCQYYYFQKIHWRWTDITASIS